MTTQSSSIWKHCQQDSSLGKLIESQLAVWPDHEMFLTKSFGSRSEALMQTTYAVADLIYSMIDPQLKEHAESYKWFCTQINEEVLYFFREGKYRYSSFQEVENSAYNDPSYMAASMQGLLFSHLFWLNHSQVIDQYVNSFLRQLPERSTYLEIGPGHGLLTALAAKSASILSLEAWDLSGSLLDMTGENLKKLGLSHRVQLKNQDITQATAGGDKFDAIILSEVLEHLEDPVAVLKGIRTYLAPGGKVFINVPVNSPVVDHIYLLESPEQARSLVEDSGFEVNEISCFPATGYTEARARQCKLTISCVMTGALTAATKD